MGKNSKLRRDQKRNKDRKLNKKRKSPAKSMNVSDTSDVLFRQITNPFSHLTQEERHMLIAEVSVESRKKVSELFTYFEEALRKYDPLLLISIVSVYALTVPIGKNGVASKESSSPIKQAHVEMLQAMMLMIPESEMGMGIITPQIAQEMQEKLVDLAEAFNFSRWDADDLELGEAEFAISRIQEMIRAHTQIVRNWGFYSQVVSISKDLYSEFDDLLTQHLGFSASNVIDVFKTMILNMEDRLSQRMAFLSELSRIKKPYDLILRYHEKIGQGKVEADRFFHGVYQKGMSNRTLFFMCLSHYDLRLPDYITLDEHEIARSLGLEPAMIKTIFAYFSHKPGELASYKREYLFLDNPIWEKPIINLNGSFFCPIPQLSFSFILSIFDSIVEQFDKVALHKRRSNFLESKIEQIVKSKFPESQVVPSLEWKDNDVKYETDLIACIDSHLIIIEAKSHRISQVALRGAPARIRRHLQEILIDPAVQSYRLEQKLKGLLLEENPSDPIVNALPINIKNIKKILRVSVSLDYFASLQSNLGLFRETGWLPDDFSACPSMNIADFETLFDLLDHPVQIIHYLTRRTELQNEAPMLGDELDYMGIYVKNLLNFGGQNLEVVISGMSEPIDLYYMSKDQGVMIPKPQPNISALFKGIFEKLESRKTYRWTEIGCILNRFSPLDQRKLIKEIRDISYVVHKRWHIENHKNMIIYCPPEWSEYALSVVLVKDENLFRSQEFIESASYEGLKPQHVKYCLIIVVNIDRPDLPYDYLGLAENVPQDSSQT